MHKEILERILQNDSVPTLPAFAMKVVELCGDADVSLMDVGNAVQNDAATSAKLLRLANSPLFGLAREVGSVHHAVSILGLSTVRMVTIATALVGGLESRVSGGLDRRSFWRGALITSLAAHKLAERVGAANADLAFMAGLLQNLGVHVMATALGDRYLDLLAAGEERPLDLNQAEMDEFGISHAEVGAQLLQSWNFPKPLVDAIQCHEDDHQAGGPGVPTLSAVLYVAESYRATFLRPTPEAVSELIRRNRSQLDLDEEATTELLTFVQAHASQVAQTFDLDIGEPADIERSRVRATSELVGLMLRAQDRSREESAEAEAVSKERRDPVRQMMGLTVYRVEIDQGARVSADLGEHAFDKVVEAVNEVLRRVLRQADLVLSWGSYGWIVVTPVGDEEVCTAIAQRLVREIAEEPIRTSRGEVRAEVSIGAAWDPTCKSEGFEQLLRLAEEHRRIAQDMGGNQASGSTVPPTPATSPGY